MAKVAVYGHKQWIATIAMLIVFPLMLAAQYRLNVQPADRDSLFLLKGLGLTTDFKSQIQCAEYIDKLPALLLVKGYPASSVDSVRYDSASAFVQLYLGEPFRWARLLVDSADQRLLSAVYWNKKDFDNRPVNWDRYHALQEKLLSYLEDNGYPFARIGLDSVRMKDAALYAHLKIEKGPLYRIDSIRNQGTASLSSGFLQRYLSIMNGSIYRKEKLQAVSARINELPYVREKQPWNLTMLGTGSILNLYLVPKRSSEVNVLVGLLPASPQANTGKLLITGEATVNLRNALGGGETIGLNWQQIQVQSPRLNLAFQQPYLFGSPFGASFNFDLFKKDSSYINIGLMAGVQYAVSAGQTGSIFIQNLTTNLLTVDTLTVKQSHRLPQVADVNSVNVGLNYELYATNYRFNPRKGNELTLSMAAGIKNIRKNNAIVKLQDPTDPTFNFNKLYDTFQLKSYEFRVKASAAHYFPLTKYSTLKTGFNGGWFQSPNIFRNEMFQIGGHKLLRGFDEESIFASQYGVATAEYRYLLGQNSFLSAFADGGFIRNDVGSQHYSNSFIGVGVGMAFETKAGIFNISYAVGKRDDANFNLRQSKIHLGYVNYF